VAAGPAPGRLFPQLLPEEQHSGGLSNCACRRRAPGGLIIPISPYCSAYIAWQRRAEDASGGNLTEFGIGPAAARRKRAGRFSR